MSNFTQEMVNSVDKTTVVGMAEALLISITSLKDREGKLLCVRLGNEFGDDIEFATQMAETLLNKKRTDV